MAEPMPRHPPEPRTFCRRLQHARQQLRFAEGSPDLRFGEHQVIVSAYASIDRDALQRRDRMRPERDRPPCAFCVFGR